MRKFEVFNLAMLLHHISDAREKIKPWTEDKADADDKLDDKAVSLFLQGPILMSQLISGQIGLDSTHKRVWEGGGPFWMMSRVGITWRQAYDELRVLRECIEADLADKWFAFVLPEKALLLERAPQEWGTITGSIPSAKDDIREALYCYALERNTAAVFHLMRVAEHGLRILAKKLKVSLALKHKGHIIPIDHAQWQQVIDAIKNKLEKIKRLPSGSKRSGQLEKLSDAGDHCLFMKDIWRNAVSHARKPYSEPEAKAAMGRVKDFMIFVAKEFTPAQPLQLTPIQKNAAFYGE